MKKSPTFEATYLTGANRFCLLLLLCHIPLAMGIAAWFGTSVLSGLLIGTTLMAGPVMLYLWDPTSQLTSAALGAASMGLSGLLIHLSHGLLEMHFHIFATIAFLIVFGSFWPILAAVVTIAAHHVLFWIILPASVFNYKASLGTVLIHAGFVIFEAIPACWIARNLGHAITAQSITGGSLKRSAEDIRAAAIDLGASGDDLSRFTSDQAATLQQTAASAQQVSAMAVRVAEQSAAAARSMTAVDGHIAQANAMILGLTGSMQDIEASSGKSAKIISVIDGIAFQTNILALNAAVEAARAGESGAGFAVVADEVRSLARRSAQAAQDTSTLITVSVDNARAGATRVQQMAETISAVTAEVARVKEMIDQVRQGGEEEAKSMSQISTALHHLESLTQRAAALAEENAAAGQRLQAHADDMFGVVTKLEELGK